HRWVRRERRALHSRQLADFVEQSVREIKDRRQLRIFCERKFDSNREHLLGIEAEPRRLHFREAFQNETRRAQEKERQGHLDNHEPIAGPARGFCLRTSERTSLERDVDVRPRSLPRGPESEENRGERGQQKGERHHAPVEPEALETWRAGRSESDESVASPGGEDQPEAAADHRNDKALEQKLPNDLPA